MAKENARNNSSSILSRNKWFFMHAFPGDWRERLCCLHSHTRTGGLVVASGCVFPCPLEPLCCSLWLSALLAVLLTTACNCVIVHALSVVRLFAFFAECSSSSAAQHHVRRVQLGVIDCARAFGCSSFCFFSSCRTASCQTQRSSPTWKRNPAQFLLALLNSSSKQRRETAILAPCEQSTALRCRWVVLRRVCL
jgi:hypothetical protein